MSNFSVDEFDRILRDLYKIESNPFKVQEFRMLVSPKMYNGYWILKFKLPNIVRKLCRVLGRILKNKYIYWLGYPICWVIGLKEIIEDYYG